jgi:hypothetical protein
MKHQGNIEDAGFKRSIGLVGTKDPKDILGCRKVILR